MRILPYEVNKIIKGRHAKLHENILGYDLTERGVAPIVRDVYYVNFKSLRGWRLIEEDAPAMCDFDTGHIYCYYSEKLPLTELRLVHEFVHRAARFRRFFRWNSGVLLTAEYTVLNEALTEYITSEICGEYYEREVNPKNRYLSYLPALRDLARKRGRDAVVRAYFEHNAKFFTRNLAGISEFWS